MAETPEEEGVPPGADLVHHPVVQRSEEIHNIETSAGKRHQAPSRRRRFPAEGNRIWEMRDRVHRVELDNQIVGEPREVPGLLWSGYDWWAGHDVRCEPPTIWLSGAQHSSRNPHQLGSYMEQPMFSHIYAIRAYQDSIREYFIRDRPGRFLWRNLRTDLWPDARKWIVLENIETFNRANNFWS